MFSNKLYLFNSRIITHVIFWIVYYVTFSFIWETNQGLVASFFLEFVLLPIRIMAVYVTIYYLLPKFLVNKKYSSFIVSYLLLILVFALMQRVFIYLFYDNILLRDSTAYILSFKAIVRAIVLINSTVFFVLSIKIFQLFIIEKDKSENNMPEFIEIKADRRLHRVNINDIVYVEGKGNYTTYHLMDSSRITAYGSIKKALESLPDNFIRVHRSFIVNRRSIKSFDSVNIEVKNALIPRGKSIEDHELQLM